MAYWLMKSEPDDVGIDHLQAEPQRHFVWTGVRNYQARNFMRDQMPYFDPKSHPDKPRWQCVDVRFVRKTRLVSPAELRQHEALQGMTVLARGNRLSITPVTPEEWAYLQEHVL